MSFLAFRGRLILICLFTLSEMKSKTISLDQRTREIIAFLGVNPELIDKRGLPQYEDANLLVVVELSASGRAHELTPEAASAWKKLKARATSDGVSLIVVSAFRSFDRQLEIIEKRIKSGEPAEAILRKLAPPGCSQHHTGRALDIGTVGCEPASEDFADTNAFTWLQENALDLGFTMPYPVNNKYGYCYEPWHWCFSALDA